MGSTLLRGSVAYWAAVCAGALLVGVVLLFGGMLFGQHADSVVLSRVEAPFIFVILYVLAGVIAFIPFLLVYGALNTLELFNVWSAMAFGAAFIPFLSLLLSLLRNGQAEWSRLTAFASIEGALLLAFGVVQGWILWKVNRLLLENGLGT